MNISLQPLVVPLKSMLNFLTLYLIQVSCRSHGLLEILFLFLRTIDRSHYYLVWKRFSLLFLIRDRLSLLMILIYWMRIRLARHGYWTTDNIFSLHALVELLSVKKKKNTLCLRRFWKSLWLCSQKFFVL